MSKHLACTVCIRSYHRSNHVQSAPLPKKQKEKPSFKATKTTSEGEEKGFIIICHSGKFTVLKMPKCSNSNYFRAPNSDCALFQMNRVETTFHTCAWNGMCLQNYAVDNSLCAWPLAAFSLNPVTPASQAAIPHTKTDIARARTCSREAKMISANHQSMTWCNKNGAGVFFSSSLHFK